MKWCDQSQSHSLRREWHELPKATSQITLYSEFGMVMFSDRTAEFNTKSLNHIRSNSWDLLSSISHNWINKNFFCVHRNAHYDNLLHFSCSIRSIMCFLHIIKQFIIRGTEKHNKNLPNQTKRISISVIIERRRDSATNKIDKGQICLLWHHIKNAF